MWGLHEARAGIRRNSAKPSKGRKTTRNLSVPWRQAYARPLSPSSPDLAPDSRPAIGGPSPYPRHRASASGRVGARPHLPNVPPAVTLSRMIPWTEVARATVPGVDATLVLARRDAELVIRLGHTPLMSSRMHDSEDAFKEKHEPAGRRGDPQA